MSYTRSMQALAFLMVSGGMLVPVAAMAQQTGPADTMTTRSYDTPARKRIDRTVVSPFETARRIVIGPSDSGGAVIISRPPAVLAPTPVPVPAPALERTGTFVHIGSIDTPPPVPAPGGAYEDIGLYPGIAAPVDALSFPASSFSPD